LKFGQRARAKALKTVLQLDVKPGGFMAALHDRERVNGGGPQETSASGEFG
jgi:hypothetical protein